MRPRVPNLRGSFVKVKTTFKSLCLVLFPVWTRRDTVPSNIKEAAYEASSAFSFSHQPTVRR